MIANTPADAAISPIVTIIPSPKVPVSGRRRTNPPAAEVDVAVAPPIVVVRVILDWESAVVVEAAFVGFCWDSDEAVTVEVAVASLPPVPYSLSYDEARDKADDTADWASGGSVLYSDAYELARLKAEATADRASGGMVLYSDA